MSLQFFDENKDVYPGLPVLSLEDGRFGPSRTSFDGRLGGAQEKIVYVRNNDSSNYYTNLILSYESVAYDDSGELGSTGWGVKYLYGERRPTEAEWDEVRSGEPLAIPDIGTTLAADTYTFHPIWIRVYCPGGVAAQHRDNQRIKLSYYSKKVGA